MLKCVIFDFDLTLFDSREVEFFRNTRQWSLVYENLDKCSFYPNVKELLSTLKKKNIKVAIVSNAPKKYIINALELNSIDIDYLVAYHDVKQHKPSPKGTYLILKHFALSTKEIIYVGNNDIDYNTALNSNIPFYSVKWGTVSNQNTTTIDFFNLLTHIL